MKHTLYLAMAALAVSLTFTGCGGGGSDAADSGPRNMDNAPPPPGVATNTMTAPVRAADALSRVSTASPVNGVIPSGAAKNVAPVYHGPASSGELVEFIANFQQLTYTWRVIQSSFGVPNTYNSGTLSVDPNGAGYAMSGGGTLFVTDAGGVLIDGLPLVINGTIVPQAVFVQPSAPENLEISDIVGDYRFGQFTHDATKHAPFQAGEAEVKWGNARVEVDGSVRMCFGGSYSPTCTNFTTATLAVNDSNCRGATNLIATYVGGQFIGCMVASSNGTGNVLYGDIQALGGAKPGMMTFVERTAVQTLPGGTYAAATIVDLSNGTDVCANRDLVVSGQTLTANCANEAERFAFTLNTTTYADLGLVVVEGNNPPADMLLQLSSDLWLSINPTGGFAATRDASQFGAMSIVKRLN